MTSPLQKSPLGVLGAFAMKVLGRNPDKLGDTVLPIADVYDQYLLQQELSIKRATGAITVAAFSTGVVQTVPNAKLWRVLAMDVFASTISGADLALTWTAILMTRNPAGNNAVLDQGRMIGSDPIGSTRAFGHYFERPLVLPSGWDLGCTVSTSAAVANGNAFEFVALVHEIDA